MSYAAGFAEPLLSRCTEVTLLHEPTAGPVRLARRWKFEYTQAAAVGTTLLQRVTLSGFHTDGNTEVETSLAPITFGYTEFTPGEQRIQRFGAKTVPPPPLGDNTTLFDYRGTSLPGVLQMSETGATWWENRGDGIVRRPRADPCAARRHQRR